MPLVVSLAVFDGWMRPLSVSGCSSRSSSSRTWCSSRSSTPGGRHLADGLLVAIAFWTWLWGAVGLLVATPLTVCLVVMGKHVAGLEFLSTLMAEDAALEHDVTYYQRLLAADQAEAAEIVERARRGGRAGDGLRHVHAARAQLRGARPDRGPRLRPRRRRRWCGRPTSCCVRPRRRRGRAPAAPPRSRRRRRSPCSAARSRARPTRSRLKMLAHAAAGLRWRCTSRPGDDVLGHRHARSRRAATASSASRICRRAPRRSPAISRSGCVRPCPG